MSDYKYLDGYAPENADEIAITKQIARKLGVKIGDTITIDYGNVQRNCIITAYFQTMNQLKELIRLHSDAPTNLRYASSIFSFQINFTDNPSEKEIERRKERIKKLYNNDDVTNCTEYCIYIIAVYGAKASIAPHHFVDSASSFEFVHKNIKKFCFFAKSA